MTIDEETEKLIKEENATSEAVRSLINVKDREKGKSSDVELKTDLTDDEVKIHTVLQALSNTLEMSQLEFSEKCVLSAVIESKERKLLSKDRKSRMEIVNVARQPDMNFPMEHQQGGFLKRFFSRNHQQ